MNQPTPDPELQTIAEREEIAFRVETPEYGRNYDRGWIGFNHASSWMSKGIARLTEPQRKSGIPISHAFIVTGEDECVEAAFRKGVVKSSLTEAYFDKPDRYVIFRKPLGLNDDLADRIVTTARAELGTDFNNAALLSSLMAESFLGSVVDRLFDGELEKCIAKLAEDEDRWICSELAAYCLNQQPEFQGRGILRKSEAAIEPQALFEADELFHPLDETLSSDNA